VITLPPVDLPKGSWPSREHRAAALNHATSLAEPGAWVECGVAAGWSARWILARLKPRTTLHLFDSFKGLPEDWNAENPRGAFAVDTIPTFDDPRVTLHVGMFADTLPAWAPPAPVTLVHVDCDLYSSTMTVLESLASHLAAGAILAFDEAHGNPAALEHQGRAMRDWQRQSGRRLTILARTEYMQLVTRLEP
jgi:predicted O-methyltransferase YrrM